jgi:hypothetical protein
VATLHCDVVALPPEKPHRHFIKHLVDTGRALPSSHGDAAKARRSSVAAAATAAGQKHRQSRRQPRAKAVLGGWAEHMGFTSGGPRTGTPRQQPARSVYVSARLVLTE